MKFFTRIALIVLLAGLVFAWAMKAAVAQDPTKVAPQAYKVLLENDRVRVIDYQSKPGDKEPMHSHPAFVVYFSAGGKFKYTFPDGKTKDSEVKAGDVLWRDPQTHAVENVGTTALHGILVELKK